MHTGMAALQPRLGSFRFFFCIILGSALKPLPMLTDIITDMDIIMTDAGEIVLVVPGAIPEGTLVLDVAEEFVTLAADDNIFVQVTDIDALVIDTLAGRAHVDLIAVPDADHPPAGITHQAAVQDIRAA